MRVNATIPSYAELRQRTDAPAGSSWGVFGQADELGTLNHLTPERVRGALGTVHTGTTFTLDHPLETFDPPLVPTRKPLQHTLFANNPHHRDDYVDSLYTQASSQLDGLRHIGHPDAGFYNGFDPDAFVEGQPTLGINRFAEHGIVGRGVLVDVDRYRRAHGEPIDHDGAESIPIDTVALAADAQGVELRAGDILMVRTGWAHHHLHELDAEQRRQATDPIRASGLEASHTTAEWLWDHHFAIVATDNFAVEAWPAPSNSPFVANSELRGDVARTGHTGLMHRALIPLLGMVLGELWALDELANACAADNRWDCVIVANPLHLTGGAGSPLNATAIR